jgi:hypothetical protein
VRWHVVVVKPPLPTFCWNSFSFAIPALKICWQELQDTPDKSTSSSIVLRRSSKISSRIITIVSSVQEVEGHPEQDLSASDNSPFLKQENHS